MATSVALLFAGWAITRGFADAAVHQAGTEGGGAEARESRHRKEASSGTPAHDNSIASELGFGLGDAGELLVSKVHSPFPSRRERRSKRSKGFGSAPHQQTLDDLSFVTAFNPNRSSSTKTSRLPGNSRTTKSKRTVAQTAVMALLLVVAAAWVAKHITAYKRTAANLSQMRSDRQNLINQMETSGGMPQETKKNLFRTINAHFPGKPYKSGSLDPNAEDRDAHADEDLLNRELTAKLLSARSRVAILQQKIEDAKGQLSKEGKGLYKVIPTQVELLTEEEALKEKAQLQNELVQLRAQRADLEAILKIQEDIRTHEQKVKQDTAKAISAGKNLGDLDNLYNQLNKLHKEYRHMRGEEKVKHVEFIKKLKQALEGAQKTCSGTPGLAKLVLLVEKDELQRELSLLRESIAAHSSASPASTLISTLVSLPSRYVKGSADFVRKATKGMWPWQRSDAMEMVFAENQMSTKGVRAQSKRESPADALALSALRHKVEELEGAKAREWPLLNLLHLYDAEQFGAWQSQRSAQAAESVMTVLDILRDLHSDVLFKMRLSKEDRRAYAESIKNSAAAALNLLKQPKQ